ncbi:MAG: hypothetical protein KatS3mg038_0990 [Candidatus Kapaibacterium sp.]|nr:MAG: hypothetical protein KatS3mg038_0990 [Candidatus Kapabacteria bacterium]
MRWFTSVVILFLCHVCIAQQGAEKLVLTVTPQHRANFRAFEQWFDSQESLQPYTQLLEAYRVAFNAATVNDGVQYRRAISVIDSIFAGLPVSIKKSIGEFFTKLQRPDSSPIVPHGTAGGSCGANCLFGTCTIECPQGTTPKCFCQWGEPHCGCEPFNTP